MEQQKSTYNIAYILPLILIFEITKRYLIIDGITTYTYMYVFPTFALCAFLIYLGVWLYKSGDRFEDMSTKVLIEIGLEIMQWTSLLCISSCLFQIWDYGITVPWDGTPLWSFNLLVRTSPAFANMTRIIQGSLEAGLYEEFFFRACMLGTLLKISSKKEWQFFSVMLTSYLFSYVHFNETWHLFTFRFNFGILFAIIYMYRGLAIAIWSHVLYDIIFMVGYELNWNR